MPKETDQDPANTDEAKAERKAEFMKQFAPDPSMLGKPAERKELTDEEKAAEPKKKSFVKSQIEEKGEWKKKAEEAEAKATALTTEKTTLEGKIAELQSKIDSGQLSSEKEAEYTKKITEFEGKIKTAEAATKENDDLRNKLARYDLNYDPEFRREFIAPIEDSFKSIVDVIGTDKKRVAHIHQLVSVFGDSLSTKDPEEARTLAAKSFEMIDEVIDGVTTMQQRIISSNIEKVFGLMQRQRKALADPQNTAKWLKDTQEEELKKQSEKVQTEWSQELNSSLEETKVELPKDFEKDAKELKIDINELDSDLSAAKAAITSKAKRADSCRIIAQGALYKRVVAVNQVLEKRLKEAQELITKLRGSSGSGGGTGSVASGTIEKKSRKDFNKQFAPPAGV